MPPAPASAKFADHLPPEKFRVLAEALLGKPCAETRNAYQGAFRDVIVPSLRGFLSALSSEGRIAPVPGGEGHRIRFLDAWNSLAERGPDALGAADWVVVAVALAHPALMEPIFRAFPKGKRSTPIAGNRLDAAYARATANADKGTYPFHLFGFDDHHCKVTDARYGLQAKGWKLSMSTCGPGGETVPLIPVERLDVSEIAVEFRGDEILVADWFRLEAFADAVEDKDIEAPSIDTVAGREWSTARLARVFGFASVYVGDCSPDVVALDGALIVGEVDGSLKGASSASLGRLRIGFRAVTMIERSRLVEIVASSVGMEEAERQVADYLEEEASSVTKIRIEPGIHYLYFSGDHDGFRDKFRSPDLSVPDSVEPLFVLSPRKLELSHAPESCPPSPR